VSGGGRLARARCAGLRCQDLSGAACTARTDPVEHSGLADRRATHRVDGGSTAAIAAGRRARCRAGTAVRRDRAPHGPLRSGRRKLPGMQRLVGCVPQQLRAEPWRSADRACVRSDSRTYVLVVSTISLCGQQLPSSCCCRLSGLVSSSGVSISSDRDTAAKPPGHASDEEFFPGRACGPRARTRGLVLEVRGKGRDRPHFGLESLVDREGRGVGRHRRQGAERGVGNRWPDATLGVQHGECCHHDINDTGRWARCNIPERSRGRIPCAADSQNHETPFQGTTAHGCN
jgi:hypothetical protein